MSQSMDSTPEARPVTDARPPGEGPPPEPELRASGERISESFPCKPGGTLFIDLDRGSIEVTSHPKREVRIETLVSGIATHLVHFTVETEEIDVWLDGTLSGWLPLLFGIGARIRVRCWVPDEYAVDARTRGGRVRMRDIGGPVAVETRGGPIQVDGVDGPAQLRTSGGNVEVAEVDGDLRAHTSGGRVEVANVSGAIEASTSGGRIEAFGVSGGIDAKTSGGRIFASFASEAPSGELRTSGGEIEVLLPETAGCVLEARTSGGRVEIDPQFELHPRERKRSNRVHADLNQGGETLKLRTSGGAIRVRPR
jgi:hypothetical protein